MAPFRSTEVTSHRWSGEGWIGRPNNPHLNFYYDRLSRLTSAQYYLNGNYSGRFDTSYDYDIMGNITSLQRCGLQADSVSYGVIDDLTLTYSGNQLVGVSDAAIDEPTAKDAQHFHDGASTGTEYTYDANGNMTKDSNSEIVSITYDINNMPDSIQYNYTNY